MQLSRRENAKRNGFADGLLAREPNSATFAHWIEKQAYISGYLEGQQRKWEIEEEFNNE